MKKVLLLLVCVLVLICFCSFGCTPEDTESSNESGIENDVSAVVSDTQDVFIEIDYQTVDFSSFEELARFIVAANSEDDSLYVEIEGKANQITKRDAKALIAALNEMPIPVLNSDEYELMAISCRVYFSLENFSFNVVYDGPSDRLRMGTVMFDGTSTEDTNVTDIVSDNLSMGEHSMQMHTMAKENNYCDIKGSTIAGDYKVYAHYKGGTVLPESLKEGVTLTTLEELIKPYVK